jgi:phenylacetate-CoA ligase
MWGNGGATFLSYIDHAIGVYLRRNILIPVYWKYINRSKMLTYYQKLKEYQWNSLEENRHFQRKNLFCLIQYISKNIPYYQKVIKEYNITFSEDTIFDDSKKFPLLTKEIIRNHFDELHRFRDKTHYRNTSGGSTGEPVVFYQDKEYLSWANATKRLFNEWTGRKLGDPMVKLWGSLPDNLLSGQGFKGYLRQQVSGITILDSSRMTEEDMYKYVQKINKIKPRLILAYTNSIEELTCFIQEHHLSVYSPSAIMTAAGVLFPELRERIQKVFQAPVFNRYGSREVSDMACNCEKDQGLHLIPTIHYLEIVDDEGRQVNYGKPGNIIVTSLTNYTMPLIRYQIGDRGVLSNKVCRCGRGFPLLEKVEGRINSSFRNKFGDFINEGFIRLFYFRENIKQFQVIQESLEKITVNLVLKEKKKLKVMEKDFMEITASIKKIMKSDVIVKYNLVEIINPSPSGKYGYVFSKVKN